MEVSLLLSLPEGLRVERLEPQADHLAIAVVSVRPSSCCPLCAQASSQVHSQYQRTLRDVPCAGRKVVLHLSVRKFFCRNPDCARKIFTERVPTFVEPRAQVTTRLFEAVQAIGLATGGELGTRLAGRTGFHTSPTTILGRIMALASCSSPQVTCLGIDDWSFRRGRKFGTILVDLTSHAIIDLLPDRNAETAAAWMRKHPEIEVVSRDRGEEYAAAARLGAPQAIQCADRFHLVQNLTDIVEVILAHGFAEVRKAVNREVPALPACSVVTPPPAGSVHLARHAERSDRYQLLVELRKAGLTQKEIARRLGMGERTVHYWFTRGIPYAKPELRHKRSRGRDLYTAYVAELWHQGVKGERLESWLKSARESHFQEFQRFVRSIERDKAAVLAGLTLSHSNGIVEGKVDKLKLIKRMGVGRAGFPLLRQRVLHAL